MFRALSVAVALAASCSAFVNPSQSTRSANVALNNNPPPTSTGWDSFANQRDLADIKDISYGEASRKYRRTVYTHDDWKKHRSQDRFVYYLAAVFKSGVYKNLIGEVGIATGIAAFICFWNCFTGDYQDLLSKVHPGIFKDTLLPVLQLPLTPFTLASSSLGLLLGKSSKFIIMCHLMRFSFFSPLTDVPKIMLYLNMTWCRLFD
jgi:ion channel-forming bestrophin family protein